MATEFEIRIRHENPAYARQAAVAVWDEVDRIETVLSHFNESSDISRINHAPCGEILRVTDETHAVLFRALQLQQLTQGAFDITLGNATAHLRQHRKLPDKPPSDAPSPESVSQNSDKLPRQTLSTLIIDPENPLVQKSEAPSGDSEIFIDLGAIGKGFSLDAARNTLADWEIPNALLNAGGSSILALGAPTPAQRGWTINLLAETRAFPLTLRNHALGASGTSQQGAHIINPRSANLEYLHHRTWFIAPDAATADALSTAAMTMTHGELFELLQQLPDKHAAITESHGEHELHLVAKQTAARLITPETALEWI